ncbi:MAG TPA: hypothetical protein PKA14_00820, partial [Leptospiraceae bacterium]|nr:hypothetical protein [Leptospiraceae bacterium]
MTDFERSGLRKSKIATGQHTYTQISNLANLEEAAKLRLTAVRNQKWQGCLRAAASQLALVSQKLKT